MMYILKCERVGMMVLCVEVEGVEVDTKSENKKA